MIFLPIAERELRVSSRKRSTLWTRLAGALVALIIGAAFLLLASASSGTATLGRELFEILIWIAFGAAMLAGLFFTSDSLSEEKREGTLGFLFLTDLRGYDVVSGKLLAAALRGLYGLLAAFPIVGVTLIMGGVSGAAFWKTSLALLNALFLSLATGLFVSSISRDAQKAISATAVLLLFWAGAGPIVDSIRNLLNPGLAPPLFRLSSPAIVLTDAGAAGQTLFWRGLLINQALAWTLLGLSCRFASRTWHDKPEKQSSVRAAFTHWFRFGSARTRALRRTKLMNLNPIVWLVCRERWQAATLWTITGILIAGLIATIGAHKWPWLWRFWAFGGGVLTLLVYLGVASQAVRFFVEARRNGLLEVLLATPLNAQQIVQGQWRAVLYMFGLPLGLFLAAQWIGTFLFHLTVSKTNLVGTAASTFASVLILAANLAALTWFGMWMGLTSKNSNSAAWKTIFFVQILPWFAVTFIVGLLVSFQRPNVPTTWFPYLFAACSSLLYLAKDVFFCVWSRKKLHAEFRRCATPEFFSVLPVRSVVKIRL